MRDTVIVDLGNRTPEQALAEGVAPREVWLAMCEVQEVPVERRYGAGRPKPSRG
jgi:hypothetical protein